MSPTIALMAGPPGAIADQSGEAGREEHRHDEAADMVLVGLRYLLTLACR
jgi:hypothetical protein